MLKDLTMNVGQVFVFLDTFTQCDKIKRLKSLRRTSAFLMMEGYNAE